MIDVEGANVTVMVSDLDRAIDFYTGPLGFSMLYRASDHFAMVALGEFQIGLHPGGTRGAHRRPRDVTIGLAVPDIQAAVAGLEASGVTFPGGIVDDDGAILRADFRDPDGTGLYLVQQR